MLIVADPDWEWSGAGDIRARIADWTRQRGSGRRLYPGAMIWCARRPGRDLRDKVELLLAWRRVSREVTEGTLGSEFDKADLADIRAKVVEAEDDAKDEVWAVYRYVVLSDSSQPDGLKVIDLGAGHSSSKETLCGRVVQALRQESLLSESVGAGYLDRNWPPALEASGVWPLSSLRQAFVNGVLTRLLDPEKVLRAKILEFVERGDFGLASGRHPDGTFDRVWLKESVASDEVTFDAEVFLLKKAAAVQLKTPPKPATTATEEQGTQRQGAGGETVEETKPSTPELPVIDQPTPARTRTVRLIGSITPEVWNRFGTRVIPKLRTGSDIKMKVDLSVAVDEKAASQLEGDLRQAVEDIGLGATLKIEGRQ